MLLGCWGGKKTLAMRRLSARKIPRGSRNWIERHWFGRRLGPPAPDLPLGPEPGLL